MDASKIIQYLYSFDNTTIFLGIVITLILTYTLTKVISSFTKKLQNLPKMTIKQRILVEVLAKPLKFILWLLAISLVLNLINYKYPSHILDAIPYARNLIVICISAMVIIKAVNLLEGYLISEDGFNDRAIKKSTVDIASKIIKSIVVFVTMLVLLDSFGFNISSILAIGGIGGAALAFASQNILSNLFGTLTLYLDQPFSVGDRIHVLENNLKGTVEEISWRITKIRNADKLPVYVPNAIFTRSSIINLSRGRSKRMYDLLGMEYNNNINYLELIDTLEKLLLSHKHIDLKQKAHVNIHNFSKSFVEISIEAFFHSMSNEAFAKLRNEVLLNINKTCLQYGVKVVFTNENKQFMG